MAAKQFVGIGECMIEMSGGEDRLWRMGFAGDTLNTAWYARRALPRDMWNVDYLTCVGDDPYSDQMLAFFQDAHIGTGHVGRVAGRRPGLYFIHQAGGDRHFTYWRDSSAARLLARDKALLDRALKGAACVYFSGITLAILAPEDRSNLFSAIEAARRAGSLVAFDPNIRPALWPDRSELAGAIERAARASTVLLPTHGDEAPIFGDENPRATARRYRDWGAEEVVVKNGGEDAVLMAGETQTVIPAQPAGRSVDPTGAGDSFNGAYLGARLQGVGPDDAARAAHATAAKVIAHHGALVDISREDC